MQQRWEYHIEVVTIVDYSEREWGRPAVLGPDLGELDRLGMEGWEAVGVIPVPLARAESLPSTAGWVLLRRSA